MRGGPKLVAHVIYSLDYGGLENGLVNLLNRIPTDQYHHAIVCLTDYSDFSNRITNPNVSLYALHKSEGKDIGIYYKLWKLFRRLRPDIVHTRNLTALEGAVVAWMAGVPVRIHGEHGRDSHDIDGTNKKYLLLRRMCQPFIDKYIPLSKDLENWLKNIVKVPERKISQIYNGVDNDRFMALNDDQDKVQLGDFLKSDRFVIGTVGRIQEVKDQLTLVKSIHELIDRDPSYRTRLLLAIIGDGPMKKELESLVDSLDLQGLVWLAGARNDIPELLREFDLFVLPSKAEGISNTILEAMSCGLPVVATEVGGNPELVVNGQTGELVPSEDPSSMADAIEHYINDAEKIVLHGKEGRKRVEDKFSMKAMVNGYLSIYDSYAN